MRAGGCPVRSSVAEHWRLKPGVLHGLIRFSATAGLKFFTFLYFRLITSNLFLHVFCLCYSAAIWLVHSILAEYVHENLLVSLFRYILINAYHKSVGILLIACKVSSFVSMQTKMIISSKFLWCQKWKLPVNVPVYHFQFVVLWTSREETWQPNLVLHDCFLWWLDLKSASVLVREETVSLLPRVFPFHEKWWKLEELRLTEK